MPAAVQSERLVPGYPFVGLGGPNTTSIPVASRRIRWNSILTHIQLSELLHETDAHTVLSLTNSLIWIAEE